MLNPSALARMSADDQVGCFWLMSYSLLHLSHTDIRSDSRILKELQALKVLENYERVAIGVERNEEAPPNVGALAARIVTIRLFTKSFRWLPRPFRYTLSMLELTFACFFRGISLKPVVVHCHDILVLPAGCLIKLLTKCKLVYDAHELESNKNGQSRLLSKGTLLVERLCWRWVDLLVSVSDSILAWYGTNLGPKENILVLNSPELDCRNDVWSGMGGSEKYFHKLYGISENKLVFVYLGVLGKGRGIEIALEAFATSSLDAHLVLVGYGDLSFRIQSYCDKFANIHLHEPVPHDQVVALVKNADIGLCLVENVSLSDYYCLPNKLFEYAFAGLHVLGSDFPEIRKVVNQYSLGTCCALDPDKVREAIHFLNNHRPTRVDSELIELSWDTQADRLVRGYRGLLGSRAGIATS